MGRRIAIIRGSYFNKYEMQNYEPLVEKFEITGFAGLRPIHENFAFPLVKLPSPVDLPNFPLKMPILNRLFLGDAMYLFGLEEKLKGFDVVHTRETYFHFTQQALNAKRKGWVKKVICTCSETIPFNHEEIWFRRKYKQKALKEVDTFHCLTKRAKECLIQEGCNPKKIVVFPYGIDLEKFKPQRKKVKNKNFKIIFIGRLVKEKGIYDVLKIFIKLAKTSKNINLTIIGNGPERQNIISLINQIRYRLPYISKNISFAEHISYSKIPKILSNQDILLLLSRPTKYWEEYLGMVLIESMACGVPVLASDCGSIKEVVGEAGIVIMPGDWKAGVKNLKNLIKNPGKLNDIGQRALKRARKKYDCTKMSLKIAKLWTS